MYLPKTRDDSVWESIGKISFFLYHSFYSTFSWKSYQHMIKKQNSKKCILINKKKKLSWLLNDVIVIFQYLKEPKQIIRNLENLGRELRRKLINKKINFICTYYQELGSIIWKGDSFHNSNENHTTPEDDLIKDI